jgi:hypothetical protein
MSTLTVKATDKVTGLSASKSATFTVDPAGASVLRFIGYTPGQGTAEVGPGTVDLAGWQTMYQRTGPGSPASTGAAYAMCLKDFQTGAYPNFPSAWGGNSKLFAANNGGVAMMPITVFNNVPTAAQIESFLKTLPSGQKCAFQFQSEQEAGITSSAFLSGWATISANLNTALSNLGGSFYTRSNFPMVTSSRMDYYAANPGSTAFLPPPSQVDSYGLDAYHRNIPGSAQSVPLSSDPRFLGWEKSVHNVAGSDVSVSFPEYGISFANNTYSASNEQARADLLKADWEFMTGVSRPFTQPMLFWNYWYQMDSFHFCFPLADGTETVQQAAPTIQQWQAMIAAAG